MKGFLLVLASALSTLPAMAAGSGGSEGAVKYFEGVTLTDQNGRVVELYRDVIAGHSVVINTFFTHCAASCPVTMNTLKALQAHLGARTDTDVRLVSITVDAGTDTPVVLHDYAVRLKAKPGWYFLTGSSDQVATALRRIGQYSEQPADHMDLLVIGNDRTGLWKKVLATAPPADVERIALGVADDRGE